LVPRRIHSLGGHEIARQESKKVLRRRAIQHGTEG
jgi:hypothetical protein